MSLLPPDFCAGSPQEFADAIAAAMRVTLPSTSSTVNTGSNTPTDRNSPWVRYGSNDAAKPDGVWFFSGGYWCLAHPIAPASPLFCFVYIQRDVVPTYDGGTDGAVTSYSGPMWQIATEMNGRVPVGADGVSGSRFEISGVSGGEEKVALNVAQLPQHSHTLTFDMYKEDGNNENHVANAGGSFENTHFSGATSSIGGNESHENMPPYRTGCWLKRTARKYYTIAP
jgi:hypothetical protein